MANPFPIDLGRKCGECYACCIHLGIEALKKWPGQSCKHLDGSHGPLTRCTVYDNRPQACVGYWCAWIGGFGSDDYRPDKSGLLATFYPPVEGQPFIGRFNASIHVIDEKLSGIILDVDSKLNRMIAMLLEEGCAEIRVVFSPVTRGERMYQLKDGKVYVGLILPPTARDEYEELNFVVRNEPVAAFHTGQVEEPKI